MTESRERVALRAPAKINLTLDVLGRRPDGYHEIASIMQTISLADTVSVARAQEGSGISLTVAGPESAGVPNDRHNLAWRAAEAFGARDIAIHIDKRIPTQAGLGGGSSDCAATLIALNRLAGDPHTPGQLSEIAAGLGSDIPFFLHGCAALVEGRGERVAPLPPADPFSLVIVRPPVGVSTADAYRLLDALPNRQSANATAHWPQGGFSNDFEPAIYPRYPEIAAARDALLNAGAQRVLLCGSGSAVFGIAGDPEQVARRAEAAGAGKAHIAHTIGREANRG